MKDVVLRSVLGVEVDVTESGRKITKKTTPARPTTGSKGGVTAPPDLRHGVLTPQTALAVQRAAGNRSVSKLIAARRPLNIQRVGTIISTKAKAGTSQHPTLTKGGTNDTSAVKEAQEKLASSSDDPTKLPVTGTFDDATEDAVKKFRVKNGLAESGVVDKATWDLLDVKGKSSVGRVERQWEQTVLSEKGGTSIQGMTSKFSYKIDDKKILVSVGINFVSDATHPPKDLAKVTDKWKKRILGRWNQFKAVKDDGKESREIEFEIVSTGGNTVNVIDAMVGSDAANWSVPDNENDNGPSHEFGHMIGLADEYRKNLDDYKELHPGMSDKDLEKAKGEFFGGQQYSDKTSMMGIGALSKHDDKSADPEPRHLREFAGYVEKFLGGKWDAAKK